MVANPKKGLKFNQKWWPTQKTMGNHGKRWFCTFSALLSMILGLVFPPKISFSHNEIYHVWLLSRFAPSHVGFSLTNYDEGEADKWIDALIEVTCTAVDL